MKGLLLFVLSVIALLLLGASVASANAGPPRPTPAVEPSTTVAAVAGGVGAVLVGLWIVRRPRP